MRDQLLALLSLLCLLSTAVSQDIIETCPGAAGPQPSDPALPRLPSDEFQVRIEGNILNQNSTFVATQYFHRQLNKGKVVMYRQATEYTLLFDYNTGEVLGTSGTSCQLNPIGGRAFQDLFGSSQGGQIMTVEHIFRFGEMFNQTYLGQKIVRGIRCHHWRSCLGWPDLGADFTIDWYWTVERWTTAEEYQVPVRLDVSGVANNSRGLHDFHHIYDFFDFRATLQDPYPEAIFETPDLVVCPGRKNTRPLPELPAQYNYREEVILPLYGYVLNTDIWYDSKNRLMRLDSFDRSTQDNMAEVHDYNTGVRYVIDKTLGNCSVSALTNDTFDDVDVSNGSSGYRLRMKSPMELFLIGDKDQFAYNGKKLYRGNRVDRWIGVTDMMKLPGVDKVNSTVEIYFQSDNSQGTANSGAGNSIPPILTGLQVYSEQAGFLATYHVYNWNPNSPDPSLFDISACFPEKLSQHFQITFPLKYKPEYDAYKNFIATEVVFALSYIAAISAVRLARPEVRYNETEAYFIATLLDKAPPEAQFTAIAKKQLLQTDDEQVFVVNTPQQCAGICVSWDNFTCNSFDFCPDIGGCLLSKKHTSDGMVDTQDNINCTHYSRTIDGGVAEPGLQEAMADMKELVSSGLFTVSFPVMKDDDIQFVDVIASSLADDIQRNTVVTIKEATDKKFTSGVLAAVALVMLVIGIIIGIVVFFFFSRRRPSNHDDGMNVQYSKSDQ